MSAAPIGSDLFVDLEQLRADLPEATGPRQVLTVQLAVSSNQAEFVTALALLHVQFVGAMQVENVDLAVRLMCNNMRSLLLVFLNLGQQHQTLPEHYFTILDTIVSWKEVDQAKEIIFSWIERNVTNDKAYKVIQACTEHLFPTDEKYRERLENVLIKIAFLNGDDDPFSSGFGRLFAFMQLGNVKGALQFAEENRFSRALLEKCVIRGLAWALDTASSAIFFATALKVLQTWVEQPLEYAPCKETLAKAYNNPNVNNLTCSPSLRVNRQFLQLASPSFVKALEQNSASPLLGKIVAFLYTGKIEAQADEAKQLAKLAHQHSLTRLTNKIQQSFPIEVLGTIADDFVDVDPSWRTAMQEAFIKAIHHWSKENIHVLVARYGKYVQHLPLECCSHVEEELLTTLAKYFPNVRSVTLGANSATATLTRVGNLKNCYAVIFPETLSDRCEIALPDLFYINALRELTIAKSQYVTAFLAGVERNRFFYDMLKTLQKIALISDATIDSKTKLKVLSFCSELRHLELGQLLESHLVDLFEYNFPKLTTLKLAFSAKAVDTQAILQALQKKQLIQLEEFAIDGPFGLELLDEAFLPQLHTLNIRLKAEEVDPAALIEKILQVGKKCLFLETLELRFSSKQELSFAGIKALFEFRRLSTLTLNGQKFTRQMLSEL